MVVSTTVLAPREPAIDLVRIISEGTYTSFAQSIKEFISNAYDADAGRVDITIDDEAERIVIRDDGIGMTAQEFGDVYASIARSGKAAARTLQGRTGKGRSKVGRFGIGALAVASIAERFTVRSTKRGQRDGFQATIDLAGVRNQFRRDQDLSKHWKFDCSTWGNESPSLHFTELCIEGLRDDIRDQIQRPGQITAGEFVESVRLLSGEDELRWRLGLICPVAYECKYPIDARYLRRPDDSIVFHRAGRALKDAFTVSVNQQPVLRPISLPRYQPNRLKDPTKARHLLQRGLGFELTCFRSRAGSPLTYEGYLVTQAMQVFPEEVRGILVRVRGVAVGWHRTLNLSTTAPAPILQSISGEVWVDGLDEALQFDRESFREDHPLFEQFRRKMCDLLDEEAQHARQRSERRTRADAQASGKKHQRGGDRNEQSQSASGAADGGSPTAAGTAQHSRSTDTAKSAEQFLAEDIFASMPSYITNIVRQVNGCWAHQYFEACAIMARRLVETLLIEVYSRRGWASDLREPSSNDYAGLKAIVNKFKGDSRFQVDSREGKGLDSLKELGDIAAHDHRIRVRKGDLLLKRDGLRYAGERLVFRIGLLPSR